MLSLPDGGIVESVLGTDPSIELSRLRSGMQSAGNRDDSWNLRLKTPTLSLESRQETPNKMSLVISPGSRLCIPHNLPRDPTPRADLLPFEEQHPGHNRQQRRNPA